MSLLYLFRLKLTFQQNSVPKFGGQKDYQEITICEYIIVLSQVPSMAI